LSKQCCCSSSQDFLEEQQLAVGHQYLMGLLRRSVTGCIYTENSLAMRLFIHAIAFGYIIVVASACITTYVTSQLQSTI